MLRILIIRLAAVGDIAMVAAILREAAIRYPERHYTLLSPARMEGLMSVMPANVSFLPDGAPINWKNYDRVIDANLIRSSLRLDLQALLHLKPVRILNKLSHRPMLDRYRRLLDVTEENGEWRMENGKWEMGNGKWGIGIAPFAAHTEKIYPLYRMENVIAELSRGTEPIYLFGHGEQERRIFDQWEKNYPQVHNTIGLYHLAEELTLMAGLRVMLTMDSSNMHLASLVGTRVISIWGATSPDKGFLAYHQQREDCIEIDVPCRPCSSHGQKKCRYGDYRCLQIDPMKIVQTIQQTPRATIAGESTPATNTSKTPVENRK